MVFETCTSTNDVAEKSAHEGAPHGFTAISEEQTAGRGRLGNTWTSPRGGIWITILLRAPSLTELLNSLSLIGSIAVAKIIAANLNIPAKVRWPNDIIFEGRKVSGTLVQGKTKGNELEYAMLGIGINANFHTKLISNVAPAATTLLDILGHEVDREQLISKLLSEIEYLSGLITKNDSKTVMDFLQQYECSKGKRIKIKVPEREIVGVFRDYIGFTKVQLTTDKGERTTVDTAAVVSAEYVSL